MPPKNRLKDRVIFWGLLAALAAVGLVMFAGPLAIGLYDGSHRISTECTVTEAVAGTASVSARGSASWAEVVIHTSDCGTLLLTSGVSFSNHEAVAAELTEGRNFRFELGASEEILREVYDFFDFPPNVLSFEKTT